MLSVAEARQRLLSFFSPVDVVSVPLAEAVGRVLAKEIISSLDLPPFPNSSMDGFAVKVSDVAEAALEKPARLKVIADIPAGTVVDTNLQPGEAARIMTGAPLPAGAEAVIPVEDTDFNHREPGVNAPASVQVYRPVKAGENVRPRGQDVRSGEALMQPGVRLRPQDVGFLSMLGIAQAPVYRQPRVAIFSTGDELLPVEARLTPGKIHDSNSYTLIAAVEMAGGKAIHLGIVPDREDKVQACLELAVASRVDLILSSAGVSVGAFDFVRTVVERHGSLDFWRVNMRPGKPLAFGHYQEIPFIGLPGNPVSAFVGFEVFVRPALLKLGGVKDWSRSGQQVILQDPVESDGRESYLRAVIAPKDGRLEARLTGHQGSGNLLSLVRANALLVIPAGVTSLPAGSTVEAWALGEIKNFKDMDELDE